MHRPVGSEWDECGGAAATLLKQESEDVGDLELEEV